MLNTLMVLRTSAKPLVLGFVFVLATLMGCGGGTGASKVKYTVGMPDATTLAFEAELMEKQGINLDGMLDVPKYGEIYFIPETPKQNFKWGLKLRTTAFLRENWLQFDETDRLPTGAFFPAWISGTLVDAHFAEKDTAAVKWHLYFGTQGIKYLGIAGVLKAIGEKVPGVSLGYNYYDKDGNLVVGILLFGPKLDSNGKLIEHGGVFVGTNLSQFWPSTDGPSSIDASQQLSPVALDLIDRAAHGLPVVHQGVSLYPEVTVTGRHARKYRSVSKLMELTQTYLDAMNHVNDTE